MTIYSWALGVCAKGRAHGSVVKVYLCIVQAGLIAAPSGRADSIGDQIVGQHQALLLSQASILVPSMATPIQNNFFHHDMPRTC